MADAERPSTTDTERTFRGRWWFANVAGFFLGHLAFSLIGHGFTGPHGDELTWAQYVAHTAGLAAPAAILFPLQRAVLRPVRDRHSTEGRTRYSGADRRLLARG